MQGRFGSLDNRIWNVNNVDFIEGLPTSHGRHVILVALYHLSKYAHLFTLSYPYTTIDVAHTFLDDVF